MTPLNPLHLLRACAALLLLAAVSVAVWTLMVAAHGWRRGWALARELVGELKRGLFERRRSHES